MPNLDPWMNQQSEEESPKPSKFETHLLYIRDERQEMIRPKSHPTYNDHQQKIIELIDWTLEKYRTTYIKENNQQNEATIIIDNIIEELDKKRNIAIHKMKKAMLKDEVSFYRLEETTLDYVLFTIWELTGRLV